MKRFIFLLAFLLLASPGFAQKTKLQIQPLNMHLLISKKKRDYLVVVKEIKNYCVEERYLDSGLNTRCFDGSQQRDLYYQKLGLLK